MARSRAQATRDFGTRVRFGLAATALALVSALAPSTALAEQPTINDAPGRPPAAAHGPDYSARVEAVIGAARAYLGTPYRVGTEGPATIDCSGLVYRAFANAGELRQVGGSRLRAAGYLRWFAAENLLTTDAEQAQRGDLVVYANGKHIGIYLGDGRVISALVTGVMVHSLDGITVPVSGFLAVDWTGKRGSFTPVVLPSTPDEPEAPAALVPTPSWVPAAPAAEIAAGPRVGGVERVDMRTANSRTFEDSRGRFTTEIFSRPIYYLPDDSAELQPIDLRFRMPDDADDADDEADSSGPVADAGPIHLSLRGAGRRVPLITAASGDLAVSLNPRSANTDTAPELALDARYADFRDLMGAGTGLRVLPRADGFKSFLVLASKPDTVSFDFSLEAAGLTPTIELDGSVVLRDAAGMIVGRFTKPILLDSSDVEGDAGGVRADAVTFGLEPLADGSNRLSLIIDGAALDEAVYPAYVDVGLVDFPSAAFAAGHTFVSSSHPRGNFSAFQRPETGYAELWHGRRPGRGDDNEAYLRFAGIAEMMRGATIDSASLSAFPYWQGGSAAAAGSWLGRVSGEWDMRTVTWETKPSAVSDSEQYESTQGEWTSFDVASYVRDVASGVAADYGLVLHADAAGRGHWKRFVAESGLDGGALEPRLVVGWSNLRPSVAAATPAGSSVVIAWSNSALAPSASRIQIQVSRDGFATVASTISVESDDALAGSTALPVGDLVRGTYSWRVRGRYGAGMKWSVWSDVGSFEIGAGARTEVYHQPDRLAF
jgi:hypothetical protein